MPRLPLVSSASDEPAALRTIFASIRERGLNVPNLYLTLGHSPRMLKAWIDMFWPLRYEASSSRHIRELIVMRVASLNNATYVWSHHRPMALAAGISHEKLRSLGNWQSSPDFTDEERACLAYIDAAIAKRVDDLVFRALQQHFSSEAIIELTLVACMYTSLALLSEALEIELEEEFIGSSKGGARET